MRCARVGGDRIAMTDAALVNELVDYVVVIMWGVLALVAIGVLR